MEIHSAVTCALSLASLHWKMTADIRLLLFPLEIMKKSTFSTMGNNGF